MQGETRFSFHRVELIAPQCLGETMGYLGKSRWLGLYWEPELNQVCYIDGETVNAGNEAAWQLFCTHPEVKSALQPYHLGNDDQPMQHYLLLDRSTRKLYVGESHVVESYLREPQALELLAEMDALDGGSTLETIQYPWISWLNRQSKPVLIGGALLVLLAVPAAGAGAAILIDEMDWIEIEFLD